MSTSTRPTRTVRSSAGRLAAGLIAATLLAGCASQPAITPPAETPTETTASVTPSTSATPSEAASVTPASPSVPATPTPTPSASAPATPALTRDSLTPAQAEEFGACLDKTVAPGSSGACAALVVKHLKDEGFYPWSLTKSISVAGANTILNYQRSRGLTANARVTEATWLALATKAPAVPEVIPDSCKTAGVVLCVDQAHRKLTYLKDGQVVKSIPVRLGGWADHPKTKQWRVFPTANGTYRVYNKMVSPPSENYGAGAMPYSVMFDPNMYVHYSSGFKSVGYAKSSHGCVNVGNLADAKWFYANTPVGAKVVVFT